MKTKTTTFLLSFFLLFALKIHAQLVIQDNTTFDTSSQMLLANEMFESGEPFAEALGYNLDNLDPMIVNTPDSTAYTTGIENYEYSRYLLNTLTGRSAMGLHMMWSPVVMANAAMQDASFDGSFTGGTPNGYNEDDMLMMMIGNFGANANQTPPSNAFPQFADFMTGNTNLPQTVAADFQMNFGSTRWDRSLMDKTLNPGAMGQSMLKQYFWAQDMLSAFHDGNDTEIVANGSNSPDLPGSPNFDPNNDIFYGGNNIDGYIGQVLTAVSINKTKLLINQLAYDGANLGSVDPATYDPAGGIKYFPRKIAITETSVLSGLPPKAATFSVTDSDSNLFDQLSYLSASASFTTMMNPNDNSDAAHLAYHEVFDGYPFPASMSETGTPGPYDLMKGTSKVIFLNIMAMHYNTSAGTFIDDTTVDNNGQITMGNYISTENASYIIIALSKFSAAFNGTSLQANADAAILSQANFIVNSLKDPSGGYYNGFTIGGTASSDPKTLSANTAVIRGLFAAYQATGNNTFLTEANNAYNYLINNFYVAPYKVFRSEIGNNTATYNPKNLAFLSGALREASMVGGQSEASIIYTRFFKTVFNKMILSEAGATGEIGGDSDGDNIPYIVGGSKPFVFAQEGTINLSNLAVSSFDTNTSFSIYPNPAKEIITINHQLTDVDNLQIKISNMLGQTLMVRSFSSNTPNFQNIEIPISYLKAGSYWVQITSNHKNIGVKKLLVE